MSELAAMPLARLRLAGRLLLVLAMAVAIGWILAHHDSLDAPEIALAIARYPAAPLFFILANVVASLIFFPRTVLAVAAGALFGVGWGTVWATLASVLGAVAGFLMARYLNSGLLDLEGLRRVGPILLRAERGGWRAVAVLRLIPVIPNSLTNYALGLTRLDLRAFVVGTVLGQLPLTIACAELGAAGETLAAGKAGWLEPTLIGLAALALSAIVPRVIGTRG
jgi:uncharacterized membrane protein YdjX (TVP38/TMEM64 family)